MEKTVGWTIKRTEKRYLKLKKIKHQQLKVYEEIRNFLFSISICLSDWHFLMVESVAVMFDSLVFRSSDSCLASAWLSWAVESWLEFSLWSSRRGDDDGDEFDSDSFLISGCLTMFSVWLSLRIELGCLPFNWLSDLDSCSCSDEVYSSMLDVSFASSLQSVSLYGLFARLSWVLLIVGFRSELAERIVLMQLLATRDNFLAFQYLVYFRVGLLIFNELPWLCFFMWRSRFVCWPKQRWHFSP